MARARIPLERQVASPKSEIAIEEIYRISASGVRSDFVFADAVLIKPAIPPCAQRACFPRGGHVPAAEGLSDRCRHDLPNRDGRRHRRYYSKYNAGLDGGGIGRRDVSNDKLAVRYEGPPTCLFAVWSARLTVRHARRVRQRP